MSNKSMAPMAYGEPAVGRPAVQGRPISSQYGAIPQDPKGAFQETRFAEGNYKKWNDVLWAVFFVLHLIALGATTFYIYRAHPLNFDNSDVPELKTSHPNLSIHTLSPILGVSFGGGVAIAVVFFYFTKYYTTSMIWISLVSVPVYLTLLMIAGVTFLHFSGLNCVCIALCVFVTGLFAYFARRFIPFAEAILSLTFQAVDENPHIFSVSVVLLLANLVWLVGFSVCVLVFVHAKVNPYSYIALLFSFFWTSQVLMNMQHCTSCGIFGVWYFLPGASSPAVAWQSLRRCCTNAFGSICFGSFVVAAIKTMRAIVEYARASANSDDPGFAGCFLCLFDCLLGILEDLIELFNRYAYVNVAMYGQDFVTAGKKTWNMFKVRGWEALVNDDITGSVLGLATLLCGVLAGGGGALYGYLGPFSAQSSGLGQVDGIAVLVCGLSGVVAGGLAMGLFTSVLSSGVTTLYVCFADDQDIMGTRNPAAFAKLDAAWQSIYGREIASPFSVNGP